MARNSGIQSKHLFMGGLAILGVYVANEMYKKYKLQQLVNAAISGKGSVADVLNQIAPGVPPQQPSFVVPPTAGLPGCDAMFPYVQTDDANLNTVMKNMTDANRRANRLVGNCA